MKAFKVVKFFARLGEKLVGAFESAVDFADYVIHRKELSKRSSTAGCPYGSQPGDPGGPAPVL